MSHYVSAREDALHHLGRKIPASTLTALDALDRGGLSGWNVKKYPSYTQVQDQQLPIPDRFAVVRNSPTVPGMMEVMGEVGKGYNIIQMEDLAPLLDVLKEESGATFEAAGELEGGRRAFITLKLPGVAKVGGVDVVDNYITVMNSLDGNSSTSMMITPVRVEGASTLNLAFQGAEHTFKVRHTVGAHKLLAAQAREALEFTFNYLDRFQEEADRMLAADLTQARFEELISSNFGAPAGAPAPTVTRTQNKLDHMAELFSDSYQLAGVRGTTWAGLTALTEWHDHFSPVRGAVAGNESDVRSRKALMDPAFKNKALNLMKGQM